VGLSVRDSVIGKMGSKKEKSIWRKFSEFELLTYIFDSKRATPLPREVLVNLELPSHATIKPKKGIERPTPYGYIFESNQVLTSKYNLLTFFPKNLLEQFRRIANVFFLGQSLVSLLSFPPPLFPPPPLTFQFLASPNDTVLVVLQFFPRFTTVSPALAALPLIVVLGITAIKDAYEDMKRHQSDRAINRIQVSNSFIPHVSLFD
jgi:phospholipid-translocating ATPase